VERDLHVLVCREKLIDGLPAARIGAIVVEDHHAARRQQRIDSVDAGFDRTVPIAIDVGQSDRARRMQGLFEETFYQLDPIPSLAEAEALKIAADDGDEVLDIAV